jgi:predicted metal-dependent hydrolase
LRRISGGRLSTEMPFKIGEPRRRQAGERRNAICSEEVPVPRLPRGAQPFITRQAELQQRHERWRKNTEAHNFPVTRNQRVALQEQFADGERPRNDLAKEEHTTAAVEHRINRVIGGAIRTKT